MNHRRWTAPLFAVLASTAIAQSDRDPELHAMGMRARDAVAEALKIEFEGETEFRYVTRDELVEVIEAELKPQLVVQFGSEEAAASALQKEVSVLRTATFAKVEFATGDILVCAKNIKFFARSLAMPEVDSPEVLQTILVHECVHAADLQEHDWIATLRTLKNADALTSFNAVVEGHAQFVARAVCAKHGWTEPFETFTAAIGKVPDIDDLGMKTLIRAAVISASWAYYEGEDFITAIHEAGGREAIAKAFASPPDSPVLIENPEWFLHPEKRPDLSLDCDAAFDEFEKPYVTDEWSNNRGSLTKRDLAGALSLLPKEDVERVVEHLVECKTIVCNWRQPLGEKQLVAAVFVSDSHAEAAFLLACEERLMREKDEQMKEGMIRIVDAKYTNCDDETVKGIHVKKMVNYRGQDLPITVVVMKRGRLVTEVMFSNYEITRDDALKAARGVLDRAHGD